MSNRKLNAEIRANFLAGSSKEELLNDYEITARKLGGIIAYQLKKAANQVEAFGNIYLTPYQKRDNEIIKTFSRRNTKGALSMSHIEPKINSRTRMKI